LAHEECGLIGRDESTEDHLREWCADLLTVARAMDGAATPFIVFSLDRMKRNLALLRRCLPEARLHFPVKCLYVRALLHQVQEHVDALDVQSEWEASLCDPSAPLSFHSPWLDERIFKRSNLAQVSVNSLHQAQRLIAADSTLKWGCRVATSIGRQTDKQVRSKFGLNVDELEQLWGFARRAGRQVSFLHHHGSSRLAEPSFANAMVRNFLADIARTSFGTDIGELNLGGGIDGAYELHRRGVQLSNLLDALVSPVRATLPDCQIVIEPGRFVTEDAGIAVVTVREVRPIGDVTDVVVDLSTGFLIPLPAARFRFAVLGGATVAPGLVRLVDGTCSDAGVISTQVIGTKVEVGSRIAVTNIGAYTTSCAGPFHSEMPELWITTDGRAHCVLDAATQEGNCRATLY